MRIVICEGDQYDIEEVCVDFEKLILYGTSYSSDCGDYKDVMYTFSSELKQRALDWIEKSGGKGEVIDEEELEPSSDFMS